MLKKILQNLLLVVVSTTFALTVGEVVIRSVKPVYDYRDRSLLFSSPTFKLYSGGSIRYFPKDTIRETAVYNGKIEYDVIYRTNNLGFIDPLDYRYESLPGKRYYAFVGDSFTAGVNGGNPWVPRLRDPKGQYEVYNMGVAATGFEHFQRLLHDMKGRVNMTHIILVAITDDFYRDFWHPRVVDGAIGFCSERGAHGACQPIPVASIVPINASTDEIKSIAGKKHKEIRAKVDAINAGNGLRYKVASALYDDSVLYYYGKLLWDRYRRVAEASDIEAAKDSLKKIRREFPNAEIHLIHLPQKYEVKTGHYYINISDQFAELGIRYFPALDKCTWSNDMFFSRDGHPNGTGYDNITRCVANYLLK